MPADEFRSVLAIVAGLDAERLSTPVLPSGWTPLGMIEHLGHAERHWFQEVALGSAVPLPWPEDPDADQDGPYTTTRPADEVFVFYRDQIERANAVLTSTPLSKPPRGRHNQGEADQVTDLRFIVLHMIEETARHLGHLDAARELLDGRVGLGQDDLWRLSAQGLGFLHMTLQMGQGSGVMTVRKAGSRGQRHVSATPWGAPS